MGNNNYNITYYYNKLASRFLLLIIILSAAIMAVNTATEYPESCKINDAKGLCDCNIYNGNCKACIEQGKCGW